MGVIDVEKAVVRLNRAIFTTGEMVQLTGASPSAVVQSLARLEAAGILSKIRRGLWQDTRYEIDPFEVARYLKPNQTIYVSFTSALHLHGVISQIPQIITLASPAHSTLVRTEHGSYQFYQIGKDFFGGYDWYKKTGNFLIASPTKAMLDCLYISAKKGGAFLSFPELDLKLLSLKEARQWINMMTNSRVRTYITKRIEALSWKI